MTAHAPRTVGQALGRDWPERARCRDAIDPDLWSTTSDGPPSKRNIYAISVCETMCPVRAECGLEAWRTGFIGTVRAGFSSRAWLGRWLVAQGVLPPESLL